MNVVFLAYRDWALQVARQISTAFAAHHQFITLNSPVELLEHVKAVGGKDTIFIAVGWSWLIEPAIVNKFLCLGVHPSDLPEYRGGSPIQNQIVDGIVSTKCSLFRIAERLDAGEIWGKCDLSLVGDSMEEILGHVGAASIKLIESFLAQYPNISPQPQDLSQGKLIKRRKPEESRLLPSDFDDADIKPLYNKIRCLTEPYPNAYLEDASGNRIYFERIRFERGPSTL